VPGVACRCVLPLVIGMSVFLFEQQLNIMVKIKFNYLPAAMMDPPNCTAKGLVSENIASAILVMGCHQS
jgi:hypothetical protein